MSEQLILHECKREDDNNDKIMKNPQHIANDTERKQKSTCDYFKHKYKCYVISSRSVIFLIVPYCTSPYMLKLHLNIQYSLIL